MFKVETMPYQARKSLRSCEGYLYVRKWAEDNQFKAHYKLHPGRNTMIIFDEESFGIKVSTKISPSTFLLALLFNAEFALFKVFFLIGNDSRYLIIFIDVCIFVIFQIFLIIV